MHIAFPVWSVAAALEEDSEHVEELCDGLERQTGLVRRAGHDDLPDGTQSDFYSFAHEFYRDVLYQRQTAGRRAKGHIRIAERLSALFAGREANVAREIAMHYEAAGNWEQTVLALRGGHDIRMKDKPIRSRFNCWSMHWVSRKIWATPSAECSSKRSTANWIWSAK